VSCQSLIKLDIEGGPESERCVQELVDTRDHNRHDDTEYPCSDGAAGHLRTISIRNGRPDLWVRGVLVHTPRDIHTKGSYVVVLSRPVRIKQLLDQPRVVLNNFPILCLESLFVSNMVVTVVGWHSSNRA